MKKLCLFMLLLLGYCMLIASPHYIISIPTAKLLSNAKTVNLRDAVISLSQSGLEVYYYNESQVIAGSPNQDYNGGKLLCTGDSGNLYIVTKLGSDKDSAITSCGDVLLDLGSSILLKTQLDDISLRQRIDNPFTHLELKPLRLSSAPALDVNVAETRTTIETLISQVNADSVAYFLQSLQNLQTRYALASNHQDVATWIKNQFLRFGISNAALQSFAWQNTTQYDVVATITGSVYPDTYIIIGGHHDSVTNATPLTLAPGADDNASGTVAALEIARVMMATGYQPKCSIRFVTFAAEEFGLWGSKYYAQTAAAADMDIRLMINHDMIANNVSGDNRVLLMPYNGFISYTDTAAAITTQYTDLVPVYGSLNSASSDSHSFWTQGYPIIYYFEYNFCPWYHSNQDVVANTDPAYCAKVIRASTAVAATFAAMPSAPSNLRVWDAGTGNTLNVTWNPPGDPNITHYLVKYQNSVTLETLTITVNIPTQMAVLTNLQQGVTYNVTVCSVDATGVESSYVSASGVPLLMPLTPADFTANPFQNNIVLSWSPNHEMDLAGYHLWRSMSPDTMGELIATISNLAEFTTYHDENVVGSQEYYYYRISAFDTSNHESAYSPVISSRPVSLNQGILIVDETTNFDGSSPFQPTDAMVDNYYDALLDNFNVTARLDLEATPAPLRIADIGIYSAILWHGNDTADLSYPSAIRDVLRSYIDRGGKILFSLYNPSKAFELSASYPVNFSSTSFMSQVLGINAANYSNSARFKYATPAWTSVPLLQVDSLKTTTSFNGHIFKVESFTTNASNREVYKYGSAYASNTPQGVMNNQCVGVYNTYGSGKVMTLSFPLYNMQQTSAREFVNYVLGNLFNQPSPTDDPVAPPVSGFSVLPNHPNPFHGETVIPIESKDTHSPMAVCVYNLKGQLVTTLFSGIPNAKSSFCWDGKDSQGQAVSSGVYLLKVNQSGKTNISKMLRLK